MGTKNEKGSVSIERIGKRIRLRWRYQTKRYSLNLFYYDKSNAFKAKITALQIEGDLANGLFDSSLKRYRPVAGQKQVSPPKSLIQHFEYWVRNYRNMDCEKDVDYNSTRNMLTRWGKFDASTVLLHLNKETISARTYNRRLTLLKAFFIWTAKNNITEENPLDDVISRKTNRTAKLNRKPFSDDEIKRVLQAIKNDTFSSPFSSFRHSHYYPFVFFMFKTGVRNSEAVGLRVHHIDIPGKVIHIREVLARTLKGTNAAVRVRKETKNGKHRVLPLTDDLSEILKPLLLHKKPDDLVFTSHKGVAIDDSMFQKRIFSKVLKDLGIEHRVLYACRHTFNSRCIQAGLTPVMTAFLMGNNPETALRNYTHQLSLPTELPTIT